MTVIKVCLYKDACYWKRNRVIGKHKIPCCAFTDNCNQKHDITVGELQHIGFDIDKLRQLKFMLAR